MIPAEAPAAANSVVGERPWISLRETHVGAVVLVGDFAYKFKKPVDFGFVDFTTPESRERACRKEVALNRRLASDVYRGVAEVTGLDGKACEHLVVMRRMPDERRLSELVRQGVPLAATVQRLAAMIASFHADAPRGPAIAAQGSRDALRKRWADSFATVRPFRGRILNAGTVDEVERLAEQFLSGREPLFTKRMDEGRILDGHGDLLADDIFCLADSPRILDCLEFDDHLRWVDGVDDVAFLAMDLERLGAPELAAVLVERYLDAAGDIAPPALVHHYIAYRAFVRAKVACLRYGQGDTASAELARAHVDVALRHLRQCTVKLILVGGLPATGKSTLAGSIGERLSARVLRTDQIRKDLIGIPATESAADEYGHGAYDTTHTEQTYAELLRRAAGLLELGESVVLDASGTSAERRSEAAAIATATHSALVQLRCWAPPSVATARLNSRTGSISDATPEVAELMAVNANPWPEARTILTAGTPHDSLLQALAHLD